MVENGSTTLDTPQWQCIVLNNQFLNATSPMTHVICEVSSQIPPSKCIYAWSSKNFQMVSRMCIATSCNRSHLCQNKVICMWAYAQWKNCSLYSFFFFRVLSCHIRGGRNEKQNLYPHIHMIPGEFVFCNLSTTTCKKCTRWNEIQRSEIHQMINVNIEY